MERAEGLGRGRCSLNHQDGCLCHRQALASGESCSPFQLSAHRTPQPPADAHPQEQRHGHHCCAASCGVHSAPRPGLTLSLPNRISGKPTAPCPGPGHGEPTGRARESPRPPGFSAVSRDTALGPIPCEEAPGDRWLRVTGQGQRPSSLLSLPVPLPPRRTPALVPTMNPQTSLGPSYSDQPPRLENFTGCSLGSAREPEGCTPWRTVNTKPTASCDQLPGCDQLPLLTSQTPVLETDFIINKSHGTKQSESSKDI